MYISATLLVVTVIVGIYLGDKVSKLQNKVDELEERIAELENTGESRSEDIEYPRV